MGDPEPNRDVRSYWDCGVYKKTIGNMKQMIIITTIAFALTGLFLWALVYGGGRK